MSNESNDPEFTDKYLQANGWISSEGRWYHPKFSKAMEVKEAKNLQLKNDMCSLVYLLEDVMDRPSMRKMLGEQLLSIILPAFTEMFNDPDFRKSLMEKIRADSVIQKAMSEMEPAAKQAIAEVVREVLTENVA